MSDKNWKSLQPLRIPPGWTIGMNKLEDLEPQQLAENDESWLYAFTEDILWIYRTNRRKKNKQVEEQTLTIDLGWYPDGDPTGSFRLVAILNDNWDIPLLKFSSGSKQEVLEVMEQWLFQEFMPPYFIEEDKFRQRKHKNG